MQVQNTELDGIVGINFFVIKAEINWVYRGVTNKLAEEKGSSFRGAVSVAD